MKARNKHTGEVLDVQPTFYINAQHATDNLYVCGDKLYHQSDLDFLGFENHIDWEKRRYELAKDFTSTLLRKHNYDLSARFCLPVGKEINLCSHIASMAVSVADALIEELKKGGEK